MADGQVFQLSNAVGKLQLAGKDIYNFDEGTGRYADKSKAKKNLQDRFNATLVDSLTDKVTGFGGYALQDNKTGEIIIVYVGTKPDQISTILTDAGIGIHNLTNSPIIGASIAYYDLGNHFYKRVKNNPDLAGKHITVIGHSLGGGTANTVKIRNQKDNLSVLTLNPAPLLHKDVGIYGDGSNLKDAWNLINQYDPLYKGNSIGDFRIPGQVFMMENGADHSYAPEKSAKYFDRDGQPIWDEFKVGNNTGADRTPGYIELSKLAAAVYTGITGKKAPSALEEDAVRSMLNVQPVGKVIYGITYLADVNAAVTKRISTSVASHPNLGAALRAMDTLRGESVASSLVAINESGKAVDKAIDLIETKIDAAREEVVEFSTQAISKIGDAVDAAREEVVEFSTQAISKIGDAVDAAREEVVEFSTQAISKTGDVVDAVREEVVEFSTQAISKTGDAVDAAREEVVEFSTQAISKIGDAVDAAIDLIETKLAKCKEKVLEVLKAAFNAAIDVFVGALMVYLNPGEIIAIAREVAPSLFKDFLDMFKGDFVIDTNITAVVESHIRSHRQSLLNLFMNDSRKGIDRSLLGEISKDVKELAKDLGELKEDVSSAVTSMMAKDEELGTVAYY